MCGFFARALPSPNRGKRGVPSVLANAACGCAAKAKGHLHGDHHDRGPRQSHGTPAPAREGKWITDWRPEDRAFWERTGSRVALRNLAFSVFSEHIGFSIWSLWSVFVLFLTPAYGISADPKQAAAEKFLLTTLPTALGAGVRLPYTFAVARFGGRNWTVVSALLLLIPTVTAAVLLKPGISYGTLLVLAALAGVGGGNFASSMANINSFFPQRRKGWALGLNAGGGNIGVAVVQLVGLAVLATAGKGHPRVMLAVYIPLIVLAALCPRCSWTTSPTSATRSVRCVMPARIPTRGSSRCSTSALSARSSASASPSGRCSRTSSGRTSCPPGRSTR